MSDSPPTPPESLPAAVVETLEESSPELLRRVARYADDLAEYRKQEDRSAEDDPGDSHEDPPDDVPAKATITVKEINDNRYYYWQWREGEKIRSKYKGPVAPDE